MGMATGVMTQTITCGVSGERYEVYSTLTEGVFVLQVLTETPREHSYRNICEQWDVPAAAASGGKWWWKFAATHFPAPIRLTSKLRHSSAFYRKVMFSRAGHLPWRLRQKLKSK